MNELRGIWPEYIGLIFIFSTLAIFSSALIIYYYRLYRRTRDSSND